MLIIILVIIGSIVVTYYNLKGKDAISVPPFFTYIRKELRDNKEVIKHEECHWEQYRKMGFWKFYSQYIKEQFGGYENSKLELECYNETNNIIT